MNKILQEKIAITLFLHEGGSSNAEEWEMMHGIPQPNWEDIPEWQRDDYRFQAQKVLELLEKENEKNKS